MAAVVPPSNSGLAPSEEMQVSVTASPHIRSGFADPVPTFRMHAVMQATSGWDPSTKTALNWPKGGTVTIHPVCRPRQVPRPAATANLLAVLVHEVGWFIRFHDFSPRPS